MNVEAYNLDSLRALVRSLQDETSVVRPCWIRRMLHMRRRDIFDKKLDCIEAYDPDQGGRILDTFITKELANQFFPCFGEERTYMPEEEPREDIFLSVITGWDASICPKTSVERKIIL